MGSSPRTHCAGRTAMRRYPQRFSKDSPGQSNSCCISVVPRSIRFWVTTLRKRSPNTPLSGSLTQRYVQRHDHARKSSEIRHLCGFSSPIWPCHFRTIFGGGMPTESRSLSSEKSYSPSRLMCPHEMTEGTHHDHSRLHLDKVSARDYAPVAGHAPKRAGWGKRSPPIPTIYPVAMGMGGVTLPNLNGAAVEDVNGDGVLSSMPVAGSGEGAAGYTGLTFSFSAPGQTNALLTLAGLSTADLLDGHLTVTYGTTASLPGPGQQLYVASLKLKQLLTWGKSILPA